MNCPNEYIRIQSTMRQLKLILLRVLVCFAIGGLISGCVSQKAMRRDITTHLRKTSILLPYIAEGVYDAQPDFVLETLINSLNNQGARILSWDKKSGVVSWYDTGGAFAPLPGVAKILNTYDIINGQVTFWYGYVYGCSRIVSSGDGAWLAIRTIGRDVTSGQRVFSDGTYERKLISSLSRTIHRIATGQRMAQEFQEPKSKLSSRTGVSYVELFKSGFRNFPALKSHHITKTNQGERYPVSADRLWRASLDVITQYVLVPYIESNEKVIVFSRRLSVPINVNTKVVKPVDVIMAVTIQPDVEDTENSSRMFISMLGVEDLKPNVINKKFSKIQEGAEVDLTGPLVDIAGAMSANDLVRQVDGQLFYNENLGSKLLRRLRS